jgi:hypothetical protein
LLGHLELLEHLLVLLHQPGDRLRLVRRTLADRRDICDGYLCPGLTSSSEQSEGSKDGNEDGVVAHRDDVA